MKLARVNRLLAIIVGLLILLIFASERLRQASAPPPLTARDPNTLHSLRIDHGQDRALAFHRSADGWQMSEPWRKPADSAALMALAQMVRAPSLRRFALAEVDSRELGFSDPPLRLQLDGLIFEIGGTEPIHQHRYVKTGGAIHLIEDRFQPYLLLPAQAFVAAAPRQEETAGTPARCPNCPK
jgi:hypothetical protein